MNRPARNHLIPFLALALMAFASGCVTQRAANLITTAPNLQSGQPEFPFDKSIRDLNGGTNPFTTFTLTVGPPEAKLAGLQLLPKDAHLEVHSEIKTLTNGHTNLSLWLAPRKDRSPAPAVERGTVVLLHGYGMQKEFMAPWAFTLANAGYRVILVDLRGHGQSTGPVFSAGKYETADLVQLLDHLEKTGACDGPVGVLGYSFGADLALHWAARDARVAAVVAVAPYDQPEDAIVRLAKMFHLPLSQKTLLNAMTIAAAKLDIRWPDWSGSTAIRQMKTPVLLVGGERDIISPPADINALAAAAPAGSTSLIIERADHILLGVPFEKAAGPVTAWFQNHLPAPPDKREIAARVVP